ncbi:hypothetical protein QX201_003869 [Fusarium graminearum]
MFKSAFIIHGLMVLGTSALKGTRVRRDKTPDLPVHTDVASDCTYWDSAYDETYDCQFFLDGWWLKMEAFVSWNPSVGTDCSGLETGFSYCVEVNDGLPRESDVPKTTSNPSLPIVTVKPSPTGSAKPSPTQDGLIDTCSDFYFAQKGDTCAKIVSKYNTFGFADFFKWNPAVEKDCSGIWANTWYCVGIPGTVTKKPITTTTPTPTNGVTTPSPIQDGMVKNCNKFHKIMSTTTTCANIENYYKLPLKTFYEWNPSVGTSCTHLLVDYWVCVGVPGWTPPKATTTTKPTPSNGIETPSPIQSNMVKSCNKFHKITPTTTCPNIEKYYNLPLSTFYKWNPSVGMSCNALIVDYWVCVSVVGWTPPKATTTQPANGVATPSPVREKIVKDCKKFHLVADTTTCASIEKYYKITMAQLRKWNPTIDANCNGLWAKYWVCVSA